jgi:hypothetical protein
LIHQGRLPFLQEKRRWQLLLKELAPVEAVEAAAVLTVTIQVAVAVRQELVAQAEQQQMCQSLLGRPIL